MKGIVEHWKIALVGLLLIALLSTGCYFFGAKLVKCKVAGFDLDRPTDFSFITGNCMVVRPDGSKVYLHRLIGTTNGDGEPDVDVADDLSGE